MIGRHAEKLALCEKWQIRSRHVSAIAPRHDQDLVVDCTGSAAGFGLAMNLVRPRGTIVLKSTVAAGAALNLAPLVVDEITVLGRPLRPVRRGDPRPRPRHGRRAQPHQPADETRTGRRGLRTGRPARRDEGDPDDAVNICIPLSRQYRERGQEADRPMAKDTAIVLNNGSIDSAVIASLAAQKYRPVVSCTSRASSANRRRVAGRRPIRRRRTSSRSASTC